MRAGSCLTRRHLPKKVPKKKRLTHHAVVNILTFIGRWREILIQPCFTDSVALTTQIHPHIDRISGVRSRIPVKLNTITINGFNIENFDLLRFPTGKRNHRLNAFWRGSFQITTNEIDGRGYNAEVVRMKKQKLQLKDEMLKILQQESVKEV